MAARWHYSGDINPEYGGFWYRLDNWQYGYADFVRITPCSDAGGPDNQFWIECGTLNGFDDAARIKNALDCIGYDSEDMQADYAKRTPAEKRHILALGFLSYGFYDIDERDTVQIGRKPEHCGAGFDPVRVDTVLRAGSDIGRYVRRAHLRNA